MSPDATALIPLVRGGTFDYRLPAGMLYLLLEHDQGERADAINVGAKVAKTEFVLVVEPDAGIEPYALKELEMVAWDAPAAYPSVTECEGEFEPKRVETAAPWCPNRLLKENYVGPTALVRRDALLAASWDSAWGTWLRLGRMKPAPQAYYLLRTPPPDEQPPVLTKPPLLATFYAQGTPATAYLRCQLPAKHLPGFVQQYFPPAQPDGDEVGFPLHEGAAVFQYPGDQCRELLIAYMQHRGVRCLVEVDDNYLAMDAGWARKAGWVHKGYGVHSVERHRRIAAAADGVIVTTPHLQRAYRKLNANVYLCPSQVEPDDWPEPPPDDGVLRIGWFASLSHRADATPVVPALEWACQQDDVEVVLMGIGAERTLFVSEEGDIDRHTLDVWPELRNVSFRHVPATNDLGAYRKHMTVLDVGLAPVRRTVSSDARSDLKAIEYAAAGAYPVLSDVPPYEAWTDGEHCRKAKTAKDFLNIVKQLVQDPDETKRLAREARTHALKERTVERNIDKWREAVNG